MVVGGDEAVRRHERCRTARHAKNRQSRGLEPLRIGVEPVGVREVLGRRVLERPHLSVVESAHADRIHVDAGDLTGGRRHETSDSEERQRDA